MSGLRTARAALGFLSAAAAIAGVPMPGRAQPVNGFYVGGALGGTFLQNGGGSFRQERSATTPAPIPADPGSAAGFAGHGSFGYGVGNGMRFEVEGSGARLNLPRGP